MSDNNAAPPATNGNGPRPPPPASKRANPLRPMRPRGRPNPLVSRKPGQKPPHLTQGKPAATSSKSKLGSREDVAERRRQNGGWLDPAPPGYSDIPIMTTKKALLDGIRYHMLKFVPTKSEKNVNPTDQDEFARPVTLHRRDARQPPPGRAVIKDEPEPEPKSVDQDEQDRLAQIKAEKEAQRAIDQAKMAPVTKDIQPKKPKKAKEEKIIFNRAPKTEAAKKESELRYEEALPWHLEDADGKNVWVGSYISALSETTVAFMIDTSVFRMVPLEKWYRMTSKPPFQTYTVDQAEALMNRKMLIPRWQKRHEDNVLKRADVQGTRASFYGKGPMIKTESDTFRAATRAEKMEHDDLDVSGDEFQDDDEQPTLERQEDEDTKEANERIKREQLGANNFGEGDEQELEKELKEKLQEELERQTYGKATKKKLIKHDNEDQYASDDTDEKPWTSSSESESEHEEEEKEETNEQKEPQDVKSSQNAEDKEKGKASGSSSKGTNTPKKAKVKSLKRAGSPVSESSGNESVRKKAKVKKTAVGTSAAAVNSARGSRAGTPVPGNAPIGKRKINMGAGSGSDGEATAGEMSDSAGAKKKKIKLVGSNRGTPTVSRAGSPNPPQADSLQTPGSPRPITKADILAHLRDDGVPLSEMLGVFKARRPEIEKKGPERDAFIKLVKEVCVAAGGKLYRRNNAASPDGTPRTGTPAPA
ncbi:hypothetical protein NLU13_5000 [Sarocladium strictum]|uniref:Transcription initiation factor IIF subunit alpha n=1 Tax=Sarocladium strictum TaxID=5046 RepID=A0AA39L976_SARSR|nr:hypothetical protein NLU13_5000 [Sarocladium strictum]